MQENKQHKIVIDTNLWISFLINKQFQFVEKFVIECRLIFCDKLLSELYDTIRKPKLQKLFDTEDAKILFEIIALHAEFISVNSKVDICRDKKDNYLLALAKDSKADYLITGDADLLDLEQFEGTQIIKIADYKLLYNICD